MAKAKKVKEEVEIHEEDLLGEVKEVKDGTEDKVLLGFHPITGDKVWK